MKNKFLPLMMLLCFAVFGVARAQETLTVYDGESNNNYVPVYGFYTDAYLKCEMVYPAAELEDMTGGTINSIKFYASTPASDSWGDANFQVFLTEVANATIGDFAGPGTIVYEGALDGTQPEMEITFTTPYEYEGGNLLVGVYNTITGSYKVVSWAGETVEGASVQGYSYSSLDAVSPTQRDFLPKTTFGYTPGSGTVYYTPKNLTVSDITTTSATLTWEAGNDETSWGVEYKKAAVENWTSAGTVNNTTITLNTLESSVMYDVRVKSIYSGGESGWTQASFATEACEASDKGAVAYTLTDTYGDGWNGCKLQIYLGGTDILIEELTITHISGGSNSDNLLEGSLMLCYDVDYDLVWVAGSYAYETGFVLTGPDGGTIYEFHGTGSSSGPTPDPGVLTTFQIHMATCMRPNALAASNVVYNGATLTWTPGADGQNLWQVIYAAGNVAPDDITMTPVEVSAATYTITGLEEATTYSAYVRSVCGDDDLSIWSAVCNFTTPLQFPIPTGLAVGDITAISAKADWTGVAETYNLRYRKMAGLDESFENENIPTGWIPNNWNVMSINDYYMAGTPLFAAEGRSCMASKSMDDSGTGLTPLYVDNWLISPKVDLGGTLEFYVGDLGSDYVENFSVYISTTGTQVTDFTAIAENVSTPGVMVSSVNAWAYQSYDLSAYEGQQGFIAIRHHDAAGYYLFVDAVSLAGEAFEWNTMEDVTSPTTMQGLIPLTRYEAQVQGVYDDGNSLWTGLVRFTTLAADAMPTSVTVDNITATTADVVVVGSQETYNIRYRKAAVNNGMEEDFTGIENGGLPDGWTVIDNDGDGNNWHVWVLALDNGSYQITLSSNSYINYVGALTPDNWVITPQRRLGAQVSFDAWGQDPSYAAEVFRVYYSITGTEVEDFVALTGDITTTSTQTTYAFDLPAAAIGKQGYIAIRHYNVTDQYVLNVTNFYLQSDGDTPPGDWITVEDVTVPYTIQGLDPGTNYEVEVQGIMADLTTTDWTDVISFTTLQGFIKHIDGYGTSNEGYYLIASPINNVDPATIPGMTEGGYDLFAFDQSQVGEEWQNYKVNPTTFQLTNGMGYLYANMNDIDLIFSGTPHAGPTFDVTLSKTSGVELEGWNLVGNPFTEIAYIDRDFYTMNAEGSEIVASTSNSIEAMEGIFVIAENDGETMTFSTTESGDKGSMLALDLSQGRGAIDRAIVRFGEGRQLPKFQINPNHTKVYIPMDGEDYAVVRSEEMGEMPMNFKASSNGTYSVSYNSNTEFSYLHLIDNMTGADVDLLATPSYSFEATTNDYASRFKLVFATGNNEDNFAFYSNGSFVINNEGEATLQVVDVTGRVLRNETISGSANVSLNAAPGVYMLRLINGDNMKVQKVVVR